MKIFADLHIHSKYSRATSKNLSIEQIEKYARMKGLSLLGTGDFQHPKYRQEIEEQLKEDEKGILWTKNKFPFILSTEISLMYSQEGRRAVHLVVLAPNKRTADKIIAYLGVKGRLDYDGRPIFGITAIDFVKDLKAIDDRIEIIPAHCMTPWFGLFGSDSGFDSLKDCFKEQIKNIYAVESGMSADPGMLWRLGEKVNIVSFSDSHSFWPWRLGREATIFDIPELTYDNIIKAIRTGVGLAETIETPPEYGKYHFDGHRNCNFSCSPKETIKLNGICPVCKRPLTIGVEYRVEKLAKHEEGFKPANAKKYHKLVPLHELIALAKSTSSSSKKCWEIYNKLIVEFENEFNVLLNIEKEKLAKIADDLLVQLILENREGKIHVKPGYDGVYGEAFLKEKQKKLV